MPNISSWIVCEHSGRWAAALRVALARQITEPKSTPRASRIREVRSLTELDAAIREESHALGLVETRPDNLTAILECLANGWRRNFRFVALLAAESGSTPNVAPAQSSDRRLAAEALLEAGALAVLDSPRQASIVLNLAERHFARRLWIAERSGEPPSMTERAWAALPWQDG